MNHQASENESTPDFGGPLIQRIYRFFIERKPLHPAPWTPEDDAAARDPAASKLCLRCLQPNPPAPQSWFCPNCGAATGDCNIVMPFLQIFSVGELARRGVMGKPEKGRQGFFEILSLVLFSFAQYSLFAPVYWVWIILKATGHPLCEDNIPPPNLDLSDEETSDGEPQEPPPASPHKPQASSDASQPSPSPAHSPSARLPSPPC